MRVRIETFLTIASLMPIIVSAQYGTAPSNYYPENYSGSTFTGTVAETAGDQVTLTFTKGSKTDRFTGVFETGCSVPSKDGSRMMPTDIPKGTVMTAFFNSRMKKVDGKKINENVLVAIAFEVWQGQKAGTDKKMIYLCTDGRLVKFKIFR